MTLFGKPMFNSPMFNPAGSTPPPPSVSFPGSGVDTRRKRGRTIRFSDLTARERLEAKDEIILAIKPLAPIEQAAVNLSEARDGETEDDEILLMALTRLLH